MIIKDLLYQLLERKRKNNPRFTGVERKEFINLMSKIKLSQPSKIKQAIPINKNCGNILFS